MGGVPPSLRRDSDQGRPLRCRSEFMGAVARLHGVGRRDGTAMAWRNSHRGDLTASVRRAILDADSHLREALASRAVFG